MYKSIMLRNSVKSLYFLYNDIVRTAPHFKKYCYIGNPERTLCSLVSNKVNPEDTFGIYSSNLSARDAEVEYEEMMDDGYEGILDSITKIKRFLASHEYDNAKAELLKINKRRKAPIYIYRLLISYNARQGNVQEAFHLYNDCKRRGYQVRGAIYTSMLTACAKSKRRDVALSILEKLKTALFETKDHKPNISNYHALLMAYSRHGDIPSALRLIDTLLSRNVKLYTESYNYLLDACFGSKGAGLRFALLIWHNMLQWNIVPNAYSFAIMIKCINECSFGDYKLLPELLESIVDKSRNKIEENIRYVVSVKADIQESNRDHELLTSGAISKPENDTAICSGIEDKQEDKGLNQPTCKNIVKSESEVFPAENKELKLPNLLSPEPHLGSFREFGDLSTPENRLMLIGGPKAILEVMSRYNVKPDIKLSTLLLSCMPPTTEAEEEYIKSLKNFKIKVDTALLNILIKRRIKRGEETTLEEYLVMLKKRKLNPDIITFGTLALKCKDRESGRRCIDLAKQHNIRLNSVMLTTLLINAGKANDMHYVADIIQASKGNNVELDASFLVRLKKIVEEQKRIRYIQKPPKETPEKILCDDAPMMH